MLCLGIESSCDDTSLALVRDGRLLAEESAGQVDLHALFGGVAPEMASREHARFLGPLYDRLMSKAGFAPEDLELVAVARGPGLLGSLLVGLGFGKALALGLGIPIIGVNHLHAHLMAAGLEGEMRFPALGLLVSGGHTHLYRMNGPAEMIPLGRTLDDAAGEAFDKAGRMLGLPYPAGKHIDALAERGEAAPRLFPRPYLDNDTLDFSFSGLKTAMHTYLAAHGETRGGWSAESGELEALAPDALQALAYVCASYRLAVVETLVAKTRVALRRQEMGKVQSLVLAGGVAANTLLRRRIGELAEEFGLRFSVPSVY
jgi:N6-L-threonylcarbamoyladenine synthase